MLRPDTATDASARLSSPLDATLPRCLDAFFKDTVPS